MNVRTQEWRRAAETKRLAWVTALFDFYRIDRTQYSVLSAVRAIDEQYAALGAASAGTAGGAGSVSVASVLAGILEDPSRRDRLRRDPA